MCPDPIDAASLRANVVELTAALLAGTRDVTVHPYVSATLVQDVFGVARFEQYGRPFTFSSDEAVERGGGDRAPSPMRYLLASVAFCAQGWFAKSAAVADLQVDALGVDVRTSLDMRGEHLLDDIPAHPLAFDIHITVQSPDPAAHVTQVAREAIRRCPVTALVARAVPVHLVVELAGVVVHDDRAEGDRRVPEGFTP